MIPDSYFLLDPIARYEYTKPFREKYDDRNFSQAYEYAERVEEDLLDHVVELHSILVKDTLHKDLCGFRLDDVEIYETSKGQILKRLPLLDFSEEIKRLSKEKSAFKDLEQIAFEHIEILKIHAFTDGNCRLARFITCKRLADLGGRYFYKYLERKSDEYMQEINKVFYRGGSVQSFADYLRRITIF